MRPVDQTKFGPEEGNCFTACVASILELTIEEVTFTGAAPTWREDFDAWCFSRKLQVCGRGPGKPPTGYAIACGPSPRFSSCGHAVVVLDGELVHDPHPDRTGIPEVWEYFTIRPIESESPYFHRQLEAIREQLDAEYSYADLLKRLCL